MSILVDELYRKLNKIADKLTEELGRPVSMREALLRFFEPLRLEPNDFAWSWRIREFSARLMPGEKTAMKRSNDEKVVIE